MKSRQPVSLTEKLNVEAYFWIHEFRNNDHFITIFAQVILVSEFMNSEHTGSVQHTGILSGCQDFISENLWWLIWVQMCGLAFVHEFWFVPLFSNVEMIVPCSIPTYTPVKICSEPSEPRYLKTRTKRYHHQMLPDRYYPVVANTP